MDKQSIRTDHNHQRPSTAFDLDAIFGELGEFGKYQRIVYAYICLAIVAYGHMTMTYVFTAGDLNYRCLIPEKDITSDTTTPNYSIAWLHQYVPYEKNGLPEKCRRFLGANDGGSNGSDPVVVRCKHFVYQKPEINIMTEFSLQCRDNDWKRTIVGSVNNAALFVGLPISGWLSDRYGRKRVFILGLLGCGIAGIIKSFAVNYPMFLVFEFLDAGIGSGTFLGGFVLGMELVGPSKRALGGTFIMCCFSVGAIMLGLHASWANSFRVLIRICFTPALFTVSYFWLIPESSRWLMSVGRKRDGVEIIIQAAHVNRVTLREETLQRLHDFCDEESSRKETSEICLKPVLEPKSPSIFESRMLLMRTVSCCFCWLVNAFVAYGLTLNSVELAGSKYTNFILMNAVEIPAYVATYFLTKYVGRRLSLCGMMMLAGCSCLSSLLTTTDSGSSAMFRLPFFLLGKFAITASFHVLYVYTTEIFPTGMRNGMMSTCSMIGRLGSMLAPQTPLLERYMPSLPLMMYSASAILSGLMVLQFPETFNTKLPDTLEEALNIGNKQKIVANGGKFKIEH